MEKCGKVGILGVTLLVVLLILWTHTAGPTSLVSLNIEDNIMFLKDLHLYVGNVRDLVNGLRTNLNATHFTNQHMMVSDLKVTKENDGTFIIQLGDSCKLYKNNTYLKIKLANDDDCDGECVESIRNVCTSLRGCRLKPKATLHTELLFLYGRWGRDALAKSRQEQRITLIYSHYIPCADNSDSWGECAGDLAQYLYKQSLQGEARNYFIIVYGEKYRNTLPCQSEFYLERAGIPLIKSSSEGVQTADYYKHLNTPLFIALPRQNLKGESVTPTRLGILAKCINATELLDDLLERRDESNYKKYRANLKLRLTTSKFKIPLIMRADLYVFTEWALHQEFLTKNDWLSYDHALSELSEWYPSFKEDKLRTCGEYMVKCHANISALPSGLEIKSKANQTATRGLDDFLKEVKVTALINLLKEVYGKNMERIKNNESERKKLEVKNLIEQQNYRIK